MDLKFKITIVVFALCFMAGQATWAQNALNGQAKQFEAPARAVDSGSMISGKTKIVLWGVRSIENSPVILAEKGRVALDDFIGKIAVRCELKMRDADAVIAQCVNGHDQDLGLLMLQNGFVSVDRGFIYGSVFEEPYLQAEKNARDAEIGIWASQTYNGGQGILKGSWFFALAISLFILILSAFAVLSLIIMRGFEKVIDAQNRNIDMLGRERQLINKERLVVAGMLDSEIKANKSKIEAYLVVYEEMLLDMRNPQRQPKYKKAGDIVQTQPALDRAVFDRNTDKLDVLGDQLSSEVIHFYARIKTKPDYINLEPDMSVDEAMKLVEKGIDNAQRMNKIADRLIDAFNDGGLSSDHVQD